MMERLTDEQLTAELEGRIALRDSYIKHGYHGTAAAYEATIMALAELQERRMSAPQLPQPVPDDVINAIQKVARIRLDLNDFDGDRRGIADCLGEAEEALIEVVNRRAAMLQGAERVHDVDNTNRQFESLGCAEDTARRFKCTGLIVTSDERKMELPRCSRHPETELLVHPFEQLMSYPPQPVMYCPLCNPSVAERVGMEKQLLRQRNEK